MYSATNQGNVYMLYLTGSMITLIAHLGEEVRDTDVSGCIMYTCRT